MGSSVAEIRLLQATVSEARRDGKLLSLHAQRLRDFLLDLAASGAFPSRADLAAGALLHMIPDLPGRSEAVLNVVGAIDAFLRKTLKESYPTLRIPEYRRLRDLLLADPVDASVVRNWYRSFCGE